MSPCVSFLRAAQKPHHKSQRGVTLVELMISLALGLFLVGGALAIFLSNQQTFRSNEGLSRLQENGRTAFELMARDIRQAGGTPCGAQLVSNLVNTSTNAWALNWDGGTVTGFASNVAMTAVATGTGTAERVAGTDGVQVLSGNLSDTENVVDNSTTAPSIQLSSTSHSIKANNVIMVCDSASAAIVQVTAVSGATLNHATGIGTPGNSVTGLGYPAGTDKILPAGALVSQLTSSAWYVGNNNRGGTSLYRKSRTTNEEIAEGVVDMDIAYLLRTSATGELDSDWVDASAVQDWTPAAAKQVVAVRLKLKLASTTRLGTNQRPLERELVHVVNIRNRSS